MSEYSRETDSDRGRRLRHRRARAWFLVAFASLLGGVAAGAAWHSTPWAWAFPVGGFVAYVLAFRQALSSGQPAPIDELWRSSGSTAGERQEKRRAGWRPRWLRRAKGAVVRWRLRKGPPSDSGFLSDPIGSRRTR